VVVDGLTTSPIIRFKSPDSTLAEVPIMGPLLIAPDTGYITYAQTPEPCVPLLLTALALPLATRRRRRV